MARSQVRPRVPAAPAEASGEIVGFDAAPRDAARPRPAALAAGSQGSLFHAGVELCIRLPPDRILLVGWVFDPAGAVTGLGVDAGGGPAALLVRHERPDILRQFDLPVGTQQCGLVAVGVAGLRRSETATLSLDSALGPGRMAVPIEDLGGDFPGFLERLAGAFDVQTRLVVFEALARSGALAGLGELERQRLCSAWNRAVAEAPDEAIDPPSATKLRVDRALALGEYGILLTGWRNSGRGAIAAVDLVQVGGAVHRISDDWVAMGRPDVIASLHEAGDAAASDVPGFFCIAPLADSPLRLAYLAVTLGDGRVRRMRLATGPAPSETLAAIRAVLTSFGGGERHLIELLDRHVGPAVGALWRARGAGTATPIVDEFGAAPSDPEVSVVVPIYGRYDFIEFQLASFAADPAMRAAELIYVIDDPSIYDRVRRFCAGIAPIYRLPFRVLYRGRNSGFAGANNFGAAQARGRKLLLLNSDVFPCAPGWLARLAAACDALPECGAVAPKLLYEDGSIQHAGIQFRRHPDWGGMWINHHPMKGEPDDGAAEPAEFAALSAACLMLDRALYEQIGGLSEDYVVGDFEDSDLCLRLRREGRRNWLVPAVRLYHLERQSQAAGGDALWRGNLTLYNCWLHHTRWNATISALAEGVR